MKKTIEISLVCLFLLSCGKKSNYSCSCDEYFNKATPKNRHFGVYSYPHTKEEDAANNCDAKQKELNLIYKDSVMWNDGTMSGRSAVVEIQCKIKEE